MEKIEDYRNEIVIDEYLFNQIFKGEIVLFAGAGISTENKTVFPFTFYDDISDELNKPDSELSFPDIMSEYVSLPDGRMRLIQKIQERFDYIDSFAGLRRVATSFHTQLSTLYPIKTIITTNWDLYFEKYCKAIPFVREEDMSFWNDEKRNIIKIHGSINSYGTIIATNKDYSKAEKSLNQGSLLGSKLKSILAEKNALFIGYSFSDKDFQNIYNTVKNKLGDFHRQSYVVTPFKNEAERFKKYGITPIITDGTFFIQLIKKMAIQKNILLDDIFYSEAEWLLKIIITEHFKLHREINVNKFPQIIFTMAYQDGMSDALERAITYRSSGEYSMSYYIPGIIELYDKMIDEKYDKQEYEDVSYIEGYIMGLSFMFLPKNERPSELPPLYFLLNYKNEIDNYEELKKALSGYEKNNKKEFKYISEIVRDFPKGYEYHHRPFLF